jgi:hypothetical protein
MHHPHKPLLHAMCMEHIDVILDPSSSPTFLWKSSLMPILKTEELYTIVCESTIYVGRYAVKWRSSMDSIAMTAKSRTGRNWNAGSWEYGAFSTSIIATRIESPN